MNTAMELKAWQIPTAADTKSDVEASGSLPGAAPRIYYASPLLPGGLRRDWPALLDHVAWLGFDHLLIAPPFAPGRTGDLFLPSDFSRLHPCLAWEGDAPSGLRWLAEECRARRLRLLLDVVGDRVAAGSPIARENPDLFAGPEDIAVLDPRRGHGGSEAARARLNRPDMVDWWADRLAIWVQAGVAGFRLLDLGHFPREPLRQLAEALRRRAPDSVLLGWTPGLSREALAGLEGTGHDFVFSSLPWWDFQSGWFWTELEALSRVAPVIA
ncbi:MAG: hypothetical protein JOZ58_02690, partial [Acetobacteraceae bacterium]|nr:hypothetical protein [Acetobacteraceae bacterium]